MLPHSNTWEQSFHNLRYNLELHKKPEDVMVYRGPARFKTEIDPVMSRQYQSYLYGRRRAEHVKRKLEEKRVGLRQMRCRAEHAENERRRQQVEREAISERSRQKAAIARLQEQQASSSAEYLQCQFPTPAGEHSHGIRPPASVANVTQHVFTRPPVPAETGRVALKSTSDSAASAVSGLRAQRVWCDYYLCDGHETSPIKNGAASSGSPARCMHVLHETITTSPTYRCSPTLPNRLMTGKPTDERLGITRLLAEQAIRLRNHIKVDGYRRYAPSAMGPVQTGSFGGKDVNGSPSSRQPGMTEQQQHFLPAPQSHVTSAAFDTLAASVESPDPDDDTIGMSRAPYQQTRTAVMGTTTSDATPSLSSDPSAEGDLDPDNHEVRPDDIEPQSPSLSDIIGSETPSEDSEDDDKDEDFDPRTNGANLKVPKHGEVRGFGMRTRRSSGRARG
jgi:hypothetical protein